MQTDVQASVKEDANAGSRVIASVIAVACAAPLILAAVLKPNAAGIGTHTQMGLPECGFKLVTGYPCATCGCTTAFAHAANGSLLTSFMTQPFGAVLAVALAMMTLIAAWSAVSGMGLGPLGQMMATRRFVLACIVLVLGAWGYKAFAIAAGG